jgi:hypothetical protein
MQSLVNTIRATGATNIIMSPGVQFTDNLAQWLAYKPTDSQNNLVAAWHVYNNQVCSAQSCWDSQIAPVMASVPLIVGEIGENDCAHSFIDPLMTWLDNHNGSYLAWAWNTYDCSSFPALISNFNGSPTNFGIGFRDHLVALSSPPANQLPVGTFDVLKADGFTMQGWSYDPDGTSTSNTVRIFVNGPAGSGTQIFSNTTSILRTDINSSFGITGNHGFEFAIPTQYRDGVAHSYYAYGIDINDSSKSTLLTNSPRSFTVSSGATPVVGDINLDHIVNSIDFSILNSHWFQNYAQADLNSDGIVNAIDFSMLNANWFRTW